MSRYGRISRVHGPSWMPGKPFLWPPGKQQKPAPWSPKWPEKRAWSCSSTPAQLVCEHGGNPAGSPLRRTPRAHTEALGTRARVNAGSSRTVADRRVSHAHHPEYRPPADWWCSCVCRSSSSCPFQRWGQPGLSLWHPLHNKVTWLQLRKNVCDGKKQESLGGVMVHSFYVETVNHF